MSFKRQNGAAFLVGTLACTMLLSTLNITAFAQDAPDYGVVFENFEHGGPAAYEIREGDLLAYVQSGMAYDSPAASNFITVVNVETRKILAQVAVPMPEGYQSHGLGISANGEWIYVPSLPGKSKKLHVLDGRTLKLAQTLDLGARQHHIDEGSIKRNDQFVMVDTGSPELGQVLLDPNNENAVIGTIPYYVVGGKAYSSWSTPDGAYAYVTVAPHIRSRNGWISKVDLKTFKEVQVIEVGVKPIWVAFSNDGTTAWVSNGGSADESLEDRTVTEIKIGQGDEKDTVVGSVSLPGSPYGLVLTADGKKLYAASKTYGPKEASTSVFVVDTQTKKLVGEVEVGEQPDHLFLSPDGREVWVGENRGNQVSIIDVETDTVTERLVMPGDVHTVRFVQY
ncbi:YncE family protein [Maritalea sp.]|jgi:DNA-binding beta-propeller fold protein YncE|uniref:YncE family protein n=1 Tax=Maritalea sp. TaxID=2003361 RepID=UPI0039E5B059